MKKYFLIALCIGVVSGAVAQSQLISYLVKQGFKQGGLLLKAKNIDDVLKENDLDPETRKYLSLSKDLLKFADSDLGQNTSKNYRKFIRLPRPWVTQLVIAAPKNSIDPHLFSYPIVGRLPYKGFFDEGDAIKLEEELLQSGLDVYRRPVEAFSTTGWLPDPILSTMFSKVDRFIELIFHELTHATFYFESEADFNEAFASWMGYRGAILFLEKHPESVENSKELLRKLSENHLWQLRFAKIIKEVIAHARLQYQSDLKGEKREELFSWIKTRFATEPNMKRYAELKWNNALVSALGTYYEMVEPIDNYAKKMNLSPKEFLVKVKSQGPSIIEEIKNSTK